MIPCPDCQSISTIPIIYGKPGHEMERAARHGLVELGSCVIDEQNPTRRCLDCGISWRESKHADGFFSYAIGLVQKYRGNLDHNILDYGSACIAYGRSLYAGGHEANLAHQKMLSDIQGIEREWEDLFRLLTEDHSIRSSGVNAAAFISKGFDTVQNLRRSLNRDISLFGSYCIACGRRPEDSDEQQTDAYSGMFWSIHNIDQKWERFFVQAQEFCNHYAGSVTTKTYGYFPTTDQNN